MSKTNELIKRIESLEYKVQLLEFKYNYKPKYNENEKYEIGICVGWYIEPTVVSSYYIKFEYVYQFETENGIINIR